MIELLERPPATLKTGLSDAERAKIQSLLRPDAPLTGVESDFGMPGPIGTATKPWEPASSRRIRLVETLVGVGILAYFAAGALGIVGLA